MTGARDARLAVKEDVPASDRAAPIEERVQLPARRAQPQAKEDTDAVLDQNYADELQEVTGLALQKMRAILKLKPDPKKSSYPRILSTQAAVAQAALNAQIKVEETRLRRRANDTELGKLLDEIREHEEQERLRRDGVRPGAPTIEHAPANGK